MKRFARTLAALMVLSGLFILFGVFGGIEKGYSMHAAIYVAPSLASIAAGGKLYSIIR